VSERKIRVLSLGDFKPPKIPVKTIGLVVAVILALLIAASMVFTVDPEEVGVVLTFGRYTRQVEPGINFKLPLPIQTVFKVPVQRQLKEEFGFRTERAGVRTSYSGTMEDEALMLTGDLNVAVVEWTTQFRVDDPFKSLFKVRNVGDTFRDMNEAVMRAVIGDRSVSEVVTIGRQEIASEVERRLQGLCDQYETGLKIEQVVLQDVNPPDEVKASFNEVNQAEQEKERMINEARAQFNQVIPRARGQAQQTVQEAEGYATDRVNRARGDADRFASLLAAYQRAPEVTRRRLYLETMSRVLPSVDRTLVIDEDLQGVLPLFSLERGGAQ
jgi:membrane protease subunit HflK